MVAGFRPRETGAVSQARQGYAGAPFVTCGHSFRTYDWEGAAALVQAMMRNGANT